MRTVLDPDVSVGLLRDVLPGLRSHPSKADEWVADCPLCPEAGKVPDQKQHLGINVAKGVYGCFRCSSSGTVAELLASLTGKPIGQILREGAVPVDKPLESLRSMAVPRSVPRGTIDCSTMYTSVALPESFELLTADSVCLLEKWGISWEIARARRVGLCRSGRYAGHLVVPDFGPVDGAARPVFWVARTLMHTRGPKYQFPDRASVGLGSGDTLYGLWLATRTSSSVVLVEGVFDAMKVGLHGVATYGTGTRGRQKSLLLRAGVTDVTLLCDADVLPEKVGHIADSLVGLFSVRVASLLHGDPADHSYEELQEIIASAQSYQSSLSHIHRSIHGLGYTGRRQL